MTKQTFGANLKNCRKMQKMTLQQVADKAGSSKSYIWELENERVVCGLFKAINIANALNTDVYYLTRGVETK